MVFLWPIVGQIIVLTIRSICHRLLAVIYACFGHCIIALLRAVSQWLLPELRRTSSSSLSFQGLYSVVTESCWKNPVLYDPFLVIRHGIGCAFMADGSSMLSVFEGVAIYRFIAMIQGLVPQTSHRATGSDCFARRRLMCSGSGCSTWDIVLLILARGWDVEEKKRGVSLPRSSGFVYLLDSCRLWARTSTNALNEIRVSQARWKREVVNHQSNCVRSPWEKCAAHEVLEPPGWVKKIQCKEPRETVGWTLEKQLSILWKRSAVVPGKIRRYIQGRWKRSTESTPYFRTILIKVLAYIQLPTWWPCVKTASW